MPKQKKRPNYRKAECVGSYGYGNGRAGRNFCGTSCGASERCWSLTYRDAPLYAEPDIVRRWQRLLERYRDQGRSEAQIRASRRLLLRGSPDPALSEVARHTRRGVEDRYARVPEEYRKAMQGAVWIYQGRLIGLYGL